MRTAAVHFQALIHESWSIVLALLILSVCPVTAARAESPTAPEIRIADVELFYKVYDAADGAPTEAALQDDYLNAGSDGLREFVKLRIESAARLAAAISKQRDAYEGARNCAAELPDVKARVAAALAKLKTLYPEAKLPPVTLLIGRNNTGGTAGPSGVLIGVETICRANWMQPDVGDRVVHLIAHEYAHVQQPITAEIDNPNDGTHTLLEASLVEGTAEFVGELISGSISNAHLKHFASGREPAIEGEFLAEMTKTDLSRWLYNGVGSASRPGDLGYWVGYRIARDFYARAPDKKVALRELLVMKDPQDILDRSGFAARVRAAQSQP